MKKVKEKNNKTFLIISIIVVLIINGLCIFGIIRNETKKGSANEKTTSIRVDLNEQKTRDANGYSEINYHPVFYYKVDNKEYSCKTDLYITSKPSENTTIYYDSNNPEKCISEYELTNITPIWICLIIFIIILILLIVRLIQECKKRNRGK